MTIYFFISGQTASIASVAGASFNKNQTFSLVANLAAGSSIPPLTVGVAYDIEVLDDNSNVIAKEIAWKYTGNSYNLTEINNATVVQNAQLFFGK